ncbi:MAG: hypothetical protein OEY81_07080, partial [Candidatus Bathyarchaeota archaeon]|nr:hypothetical protein [Candidatus Bathyarchaeota archaeon]
MKTLVSIIIFSSLFFSCTSNEKNKTELPEQVAETPIEESSSDSDELLKSKSEELELIFTKAVNTYPSDSASLGKFYFKTFPANTAEKMQKQIDRINGLLEPVTITKYNEVNKELKPFLQNIIRTNAITPEQALKYAYLYAIYDDFRGDALFSNVLTEDENYSLVWKSMEMMAKASERDTTYISSLITLDNSIRTNAELAEKIGEFVID